MLRIMKSELRLAKSAIHGLDLYATVPIAEDSVLGDYRPQKTQKPNEHTLWIDSGPVDVTRRLKQVSHSPEPNVAYYDDLSVVALRDITPGEELTHNFGED